MAQSFDVCVFGSCNVDYFTYVERQAKLGETIHAHGFLQGYGGKGANQCVMAAHLGARCAMVGKVGGDAAGADYRKQLGSECVDTSQLLTSSTAATGMAFISVDDNGGNQIIISAGANLDITPEEVQQMCSNIGNAKALVTQLEVDVPSTLAAMEKAKASGAITFFNPSPAPRGLDPAFLKVTDVLVVNEHEASLLTGLPVATKEECQAAAVRLQEKGVGDIVLTLGAEGVRYYRKGSAQASDIFVPGVKLGNVVDTAGAGDCFLGALAAYHSRGVPLEECIKRANAVAAMSVQKKGCQASYPYAKDLAADLQLPAL